MKKAVTACVLVFLSGCGTTQFYQGPALPKERLASIESQIRFYYHSNDYYDIYVTIDAVDGKEIGSFQVFADRMEILPGRHTILACTTHHEFCLKVEAELEPNYGYTFFGLRYGSLDNERVSVEVEYVRYPPETDERAIEERIKRTIDVLLLKVDLTENILGVLLTDGLTKEAIRKRMGAPANMLTGKEVGAKKSGSKLETATEQWTYGDCRDSTAGCVHLFFDEEGRYSYDVPEPPLKLISAEILKNP